MIALTAVKLFLGGWLKRLWNALGSVLSAARAHPVHAAAIIFAIASVWLWRGWNGAIDKLAAQDLAHAEYARNVEAASKVNAALAISQVIAVEAKSAQLAKDADHAHALAVADSRTAADRYIAANRVRPNQVCRSAASASPEKDNPGLPPEVPADTDMVAIRNDELQAFAEWVAFGVAAHNGAVEEIEAGTAKFPEGWPEVGF